MSRTALLTTLAAGMLAASGCGGTRTHLPRSHTGPASRKPTTVYVSPSGNDRASGRSPAAAWRTLGRAVGAAGPGFVVRLAGGGIWHEPLDVQRSGLPGSPIVFTGYGKGLPHLDGGVYLRSASWLVFRRLAVAHTKQGLLSSAEGQGSTHVVVDGLRISDVSIGINAANPNDSSWAIERTRITGTGDSGIILLASSSVVRESTIEQTGRSSAIPYGKHAIYAKGPHQTVVGNRISGFSSNGVSVRYPFAVVAHNTISGGPIGVAYFQDSSGAGPVSITDNRIFDVTSAGIYVDGASETTFRIAGNDIAVSRGNGLELHEVPALTVVGNTVRGTSTYDLAAEPPRVSYVERGNRWLASASAQVFSWNGCPLSLGGYKAATGQGGGDVVAAVATGGTGTC